MYRDSWSVWTKGALVSSDLDLAGGVTEDELVQLLSSDQPWCRDWSEDAAWGRDWCTVHLLQIHGVVVGLLGVDLLMVMGGCLGAGLRSTSTCSLVRRSNYGSAIMKTR